MEWIFLQKEWHRPEKKNRSKKKSNVFKSKEGQSMGTCIMKYFFIFYYKRNTTSFEHIPFIFFVFETLHHLVKILVKDLPIVFVFF